jgi:NAD(P)-dependent dehydrogenase (short-subunit alcohol dehydrogenase family)
MSSGEEAQANRGRPVIVSGGGRGLGRAAALALGSAGHPVCVNDTGVDLAGGAPDPAPAADTAAEIVARGGRALASSADARTPRAARQLAAEVERWAQAPATILVHAAASCATPASPTSSARGRTSCS